MGVADKTYGKGEWAPEELKLVGEAVTDLVEEIERLETKNALIETSLDGMTEMYQEKVDENATLKAVAEATKALADTLVSVADYLAHQAHDAGAAGRVLAAWSRVQQALEAT